eukprot:CAMPEP_0172445932 /NCGR_PEP_ID=MMETSP1065-20121228/5681_1 /TAXON_ID=265537 /ORGANISM="Amphiprora paludosa, Strain CCMP125" /LENGTH=299 /DNA_ID=CAMNT_0013196945 /DNA_START=97 /DNA_END=996 /DNA_ORIENTATION=+
MAEKIPQNIPFVLKCWHGLSTSLPPVTIPFVKSGRNGQPLNISVSLFSALVLSTINVIMGKSLLAIGFPENEKVTQETTGSLTAECHSNTLLIGLAFLFLTHKYEPAAKMATAPLWWQECCDAVISFCIGYMIYDFMFIIVSAENGVLSGDDYTFMAHHIMTTMYMMQTRIYGAGHFSAMICMFLGEFTNPFHNGYYILQNALSLDCCKSVLLENVQYVNTFIFASTYVVIRAAVGPAYFLHACYDLVVNGQKNGLPIWVITLWIILIWGVVYGSVPWVQLCWDMLMEYVPDSGKAQEL